MPKNRLPTGRLAAVGYVMLCLMAALLSNRAAAQQDAGTVIGLWRTADKVSIVDVQPCGQTVCGRLVSFPPIPGNPALNTDLCNLEILGGFTKQARNGWLDGWILDPESEELYQASLRTKSRDRLSVRAYVETERNGETVTWTRFTGTVKRCVPAE